MTVAIEPHGWSPSFKATCSDRSADCHYVCAEGCEEWGAIVRNEAGAVIGHELYDGELHARTHRMEHREECSLCEWVANDYEPMESMTGKPVMLSVPVKLEYEYGGGVTWEAEPAEHDEESGGWTCQSCAADNFVPSGWVRASDRGA